MFANKEFLKFINKSKNEALDIVVASVIKTQGSTYAKAGNMLLINSKLEIEGVLGSPHLHNKILDYAKEVFTTKKTKPLNLFLKIKTLVMVQASCLFNHFSMTKIMEP